MDTQALPQRRRAAPNTPNTAKPRRKATSDGVKPGAKKKKGWSAVAVLRSRLRVILFLFVVFIGYIVYSLAGLSFNEKNALSAKEIWTYDGPLLAKRGDILDRNGRQLATSVATESLVVMPSQINDPGLFAERLAPVLEMTKSEIYDRLTSPMEQTNLKRLVGPEVAAKVMTIAKELKEEKGINVFKEPKRYYPRGSLAASILGFAGTENEGLEGLELTYNSQLSGVEGRFVRAIASGGQAIPGTPTRTELAKDGSNLVLTIDERIQYMLEVIVEAYGKENLSQSFSAMVMDPNTGDILAMATYPSFDPNIYTDPDIYTSSHTETDLTLEQRRNKFVTDAFEPGSTFKLITALAGFEESVVTEDELIEDPGYLYINGVRLQNWEGGVDHGWETFRDAMRNSCNVVLAQVGQRLGAEKLYEYHKLLGFGEFTGIDFPGESTGILFEPEEMGPLELATASFGQGPAVTPLQQLVAVCAIANGGKLMRPRLVAELRNQQDQLERVYVPEKIRDVASPQTMQRMRELMEFIINAPGSKGASTEYRLAGKTGTANKLNPATGTYYDDQYICSTIGFAPADKPLYAIYVYADNPQGPNGYYGGQVAAPAFRQIADGLLKSIANLSPQLTGETIQKHLPENIYTHAMPDLNLSDVANAQAVLEALNVKIDVRGQGEQILVQFPSAKAEVSPGQTVTLYLGNAETHAAGQIVVPDFTDKTILEVTNVASQLNLNLRSQGQSGLCYSQQPVAGSIVTQGTIVIVGFR